jgi:putative acetyltransferase
MLIRSEQPEDFAVLRELDLAAFAPSALEAEIVDVLRAAGDHVPELTLVARLDDGTIAGHVVLSRATIEPDDHPALGLGPLAVAPEHQRAGIGAALMREAIARAADTDYPLIALLGHPAYYPRFGFEPAEAAFGISSKYDAPPEAWMALALPAYTPAIRGRFRYADAFG